MRLGPSSALVLLVVAALGLLGCGGETEQIRRLGSSVPQERFLAIRWLSERGSEASVPALIDRLEDEDPSVRWAAVHGLRDRSGEDFGYRPWDREPRRLEAVERWRVWWRDRPGGAPPPREGGAEETGEREADDRQPGDEACGPATFGRPAGPPRPLGGRPVAPNRKPGGESKQAELVGKAAESD